MRNPLRLSRWSPYIVGTGIGVLSWATFYFMNKALGTSTSFVGAAECIVGLAAPEHVESNAYFVKEYGAKSGGFKPILDWQMALDFALIAGAFLAAWLGRDLQTKAVPTVWSDRFGHSRVRRYAVALAGGFIMMFGARMAGGCTSGHGISGGLQLAVSSWTFFISMFIAGAIAAGLMFGFGASKRTEETSHV